MASKNKAEMARWILGTLCAKALAAMVELRRELVDGINDPQPEFNLLHQQLQALNLHYDIYLLADELYKLVPVSLDGMDEISCLAEAADFQLTNIKACWALLADIKTIVEPVWSQEAPRVTAEPTPSVESPDVPDDSDIPYEEAVDEASKGTE